MSWYSCACCRYCQHCRDGFGPVEWQVLIEGLANSAPVDCPDCNELNGTYVLDRIGQCIWEYELPAAVCGVATLRLQAALWTYTPPAWTLEVQLLDAGGNTVLSARKTFDAAPDCLAIAGHALGPLSLPAGAATCDVAGSTVHVTALRPCREQ